MLRTKTLSSFKGMFPSLHQPLPLDKRSAQQLLDVLTTSFRRQLDRAHGWSPEAEDASVPKIQQPTLTYLPQTSPSPKKLKPPSRRPTDQHLRAILSNPLFSYEIKPDKLLERNREDLFDEAVARGLMTLRRAHGFLLAVSSDIKNSPSSTLQSGMSASGAGLRVLRWLQASGKEREMSFVHDRMFTQILTRFLVAEGLGDVIWQWFLRLVDAEHPSIMKQPDDLAILLKAAAQAESQSRKLDSAYSTVLSGEKMLQKSGISLENLLPAWRHLTYKTTVEAWKYSTPGAELFDPFISIPEHMSKPMRVERAHLDLHHPSNPNPTRAVKYLAETERWRKFLPARPKSLFRSQDRSDKAGWHANEFSTKLMAMGIDTVQLLLQVGKPEEAQRILEVMRSHLSPYFEEADDAMPRRNILSGS